MFRIEDCNNSVIGKIEKIILDCFPVVRLFWVKLKPPDTTKQLWASQVINPFGWRHLRGTQCLESLVRQVLSNVIYWFFSRLTQSTQHSAQRQSRKMRGFSYEEIASDEGAYNWSFHVTQSVFSLVCLVLSEDGTYCKTYTESDARGYLRIVLVSFKCKLNGHVRFPF